MKRLYEYDASHLPRPVQVAVSRLLKLGMKVTYADTDSVVYEEGVSNMSKDRVEDFYRPMDGVRTFKSKDCERERAVRLYCTQWKSAWCLQLRAPLSLGSGSYGPEGKDFVIAGASLDLKDMRALRDALSAFIVEAEGEGVDG